MVFLSICAICFAGLGFISKNDKVSTASIAAFIISLAMLLPSLSVSKDKALGNLFRIENNRYDFEECVYATDGDNIYQFSLGKGTWIPFASGIYEKCETPDGYCADCQKIWSTSFCSDCGNKLSQSMSSRCPTCKAYCTTTYCGGCGTKMPEGEGLK